MMNTTNDRADLCFDVFESPGIKDAERKERGDSESLRLFSIGPKVNIAKVVTILLKLSSFKKELLRFFYPRSTKILFMHPLLETKSSIVRLTMSARSTFVWKMI